MHSPILTILLVISALAVAWFLYSRLFSVPPASAPHGSAPDETGSRETSASLLGKARNWGYQLQHLDIREAANSRYDLLVIDYAADGDDDSAWSTADIAALQRKPDGSHRLCLAYLSIGEAESYRSYWQHQWEKRAPGWLLGENPDWDENFAVRFWHSGWQELMFGSPEACLDKIIAQGFDGIYLDKCDVFEDIIEDYPEVADERDNLASDMIEFVTRLALHARNRDPEFLVVMQNAEELLKDSSLCDVLDGAAKEELIFGEDGGEGRNRKSEFRYASQRLQSMTARGKPVFVVEYLSSQTKIDAAISITSDLGFTLAISHPSRELDSLGHDAGLIS